MKKLLFTLCMLLSVSAAFAEQADTTAAPVDTSWKTGGFFNFNTSQVGLSNWAAGGQNSFSYGGMLNVFANYKKDKIEWSNVVTLAYAEVQQGPQTRKSDDRIDLTTKFGRQTSEHWYVAALANFKSQFAKGYNYPNDSVIVSNFFAPAYVLASLGFDFKPSDHFSLFLSPATGRFIFVSDQAIADLGTYGNTPAVFDTSGKVITHGNKMKSEFGAYVKAAYKQDIMQNVTLLAKVDLFNNYTAADMADRKNVVVNGEIGLNMKINKFLAATVDVLMIYDNDVDTNPEQAGVQRRLQVEDVIGVGLSYKFGKN